MVNSIRYMSGFLNSMPLETMKYAHRMVITRLSGTLTTMIIRMFLKPLSSSGCENATSKALQVKFTGHHSMPVCTSSTAELVNEATMT